MSTTQPFSANDLLLLPEDGFRYELVEGELRMMSPAGHEHGRVAMELGRRLANFVADHKLGATYAAETGFLIATNPDTVLAPDVAFVRKDRLTTKGCPRAYWPGAPDLAVEVQSLSDRPADVLVKVQRWLNAGAQAVWVIDPVTQTAVIHTAKGPSPTLRAIDTLEGGEVVPGFRLLLRELFPVSNPADVIGTRT